MSASESQFELPPANTVHAIEQTHAFEIFPKRDVTIVRGEGATLWDEHGNAYIDCTAGVGVASVGHCNPEVVAAVTRQASTLLTCPGIFYNDVRARLLQLLVEITPKNLTRAFLCNSGTEANEAAIKFARHASGKSHFVCAMRGFHGRTLGALSATHKYRESYEPLLPGFTFVPFNNVEKLAAAITAETAGVILEIVQGEGGVRLGRRDYFEAVQRLCRERGILLIIDEVQTGFCRTGKMFACEHFDLEPDIMSLAKAMGGGVPIGAVLVGEAIEPVVGMHGTTFGGNPLACAASLAAIAYMREHRLDLAAREKGDFLVSRLQPLPDAVREIRHLGLMVGIELKAKAKPYLLELMARRVLALPAGPTVIRLLPPLVISEAQLLTVADTLKQVLGA